MKRSLQAIESIHDVPMKRVLCAMLTGLTAEKVLSDFVSLHWDEGEEGDEYVVEGSSEKEDERDEKPVYVGNTNSCFVYPLKPDTTYEFRVMARRRGFETRWSGTLTVKTNQRVVVPEVDNIIHRIKTNMDNPEVCAESLRSFAILLRGRKHHFSFTQ